MGEYRHFIVENVAPLGVRRIGIYDKRGNRVGQIPLDTLTAPAPMKKLYSFGAVSDIHLQYNTAQTDFRNALDFFNSVEKVAFTCICGDLTSQGTEEYLAAYKTCIDEYSPNTPVYAIAGNHEAYDGSLGVSSEAVIKERIEAYTGHQLQYSFTHGDDVFIMVGICADGADFGDGGLQWLYETLEANRNRRCFVFQHLFTRNGSGDVAGAYPHVTVDDSTQGQVFLSLMQHYSNVIWFHGHSHVRFSGQEYGDMANLDTKYGRYSVHIPSLAIPRTADEHRTELDAESEGYVVDVYNDGIHLRGRDFVKGEFLPIASYWLDTTLQTVEAGTYTDPTGTVTTQSTF